MKMKVIKDFRDKYTKEIHRTGTVIDVTQKRAKEINLNVTFIEKVDSINPEQSEVEEAEEINPEQSEVEEAEEINPEQPETTE